MDLATTDDRLPNCSNSLPASLVSIDVPLAASPVSSEELAWDYHQQPLSGDVCPRDVCSPQVVPGGLLDDCLTNDASPSFARIISDVVTTHSNTAEQDFSLACLSPPTHLTSTATPSTAAVDTSNHSHHDFTGATELLLEEVLSMDGCLPSVPVAENTKSPHTPVVTVTSEKNSAVSPSVPPLTLPVQNSAVNSAPLSRSSSPFLGFGKKRKLATDLPQDFLDDISSDSLPRILESESEHAPPSSQPDNPQDLLASPLTADLVPPPVILIKPANDSSADLTKRPDKFASAFASSPFGKVAVADVRLNKKAGLVAVQLSHNQKHLLAELLQVTTLGEWDVVCSIPNRDRFKFGVISPIAVSADIGSLRDSIKTPSGVKLFSIERLNCRKDGQLQPSETVRLQFEASYLPTSITVGLFPYSVRPFVFGITQCFHCQRVGHTSRSCKSKARCLRCGGQHAIADCKSSLPLCANCEGDHFANSKTCPVLRAAQDRENARAKTVKASNGRSVASVSASSIRQLPPGLPSVLEARSSNRSSYSNVVRQRPPTRIHTRTIGTQTSFRTVGTQTDDFDVIDTDIATETDNLDTSVPAPMPLVPPVSDIV